MTTAHIYLLLLVIAVLLVVLAVFEFDQTKRLLKTGTFAEGRVVDIIRNSDSEGISYKPVFEYTDQSGQIVRYKSSIGTSTSSYKVGDKVEIVYSEDSDRRKVVSYWGLYRWSVIPLCIAAPLIVIWIGYLLYNRII